MAKTKQDYINAGAAAYKACEYPEDREYKSWQDKAWLEGYTGAKEANVTAREVETFAKSDYMPAPVMAHIHNLWRSLAGQASNNLKRSTRVKVKIAHLESKYASRAARA